MELKEFQLFKGPFFVRSSFSSEWSQDNFLATATDRGVHVVQLKFGGKKKQDVIETHRWFIKPRLATPTAETLVNIHFLLKSLSVKDTFLCMVDSTLSPKAPLTGISPTIKSAAWSIIHPSLHDSCLLGILTDLGSLDIYVIEGDDWEMKHSVSDTWVKHCKTLWYVPSEFDDVSLFQVHNERAYKLKIVAFCWGHCQGEDFPFVFSSNMSGEIMVWRIKLRRNNMEAELLSIISADIECGSVLSYLPQKGRLSTLIVGCTSGKIQCFSVNNDGFEEKRLVIWSDADMIQSGPAVPLNSPSKGSIFLISKGGFLLAFWLDTDSSLINFCVHDSNDVCVCGLVPVDNCMALMTTRCGDIFRVSVPVEDLSITIKSEKVHSSLRTKAYSCQGITASHNRAITAITYTLVATYDHLMIRDHSQILLCLQPGKVCADEVFRKPTLCLYDDWDCLEVLRLESVQTNQEIPFSLASGDSIGSMDINKLRKAYWLNRFTSAVVTDSDRLEELNQLCQDMRTAIISYFLFQRLSVMKTDFLTDEEKSDLNVELVWLEYVQKTLPDDYQSTKTIAQVLSDQLKPFADSTEEKCPFCEDTCSPVDEELVMRCESGHEVPRCMYTLLPVHRIPYYNCIQCGELSISNEFPGIEPAGRCIICDGRLKTESCLQEDF